MKKGRVRGASEKLLKDRYRLRTAPLKANENQSKEFFFMRSSQPIVIDLEKYRPVISPHPSL
jgi:hypothetical protein